jgi:hypothetical protein
MPASGSFSLISFFVVAIPLAHDRRFVPTSRFVTHRDRTHGADFARTPREFILLFDLGHLCDFNNVKRKCRGERALVSPTYCLWGDFRAQEHFMHRRFETGAGTEGESWW